jgi:3-dehydro-L-gulonate 2-dehydrogenase
MPPYGAIESKIGNNPLVIAVPRSEGYIVLDIAMSQFSNGQMGLYKQRGEMLPVDGGYGKDGALSRDLAAILETRKSLPIGFWKGSGLAILLDLLATMLSGGFSTVEQGSGKRGASQVFIAFDTNKLEPNGRVQYPGEGTIRRREEHMKNGIPVEPSIWNSVLEL